MIRRFALLAAFACGSCTGNYLDINSDPFEITKDEMQADGYAIGAAMNAIAGTVISPDVNTAQFTDCLLGGTMGGYMADSQDMWANTISNYNPADGWTNVFMASAHVMPVLYSNLAELKTVTEDPVPLAISDVMKVCAMHRITDTYGPIPYSKIGEDGKLQVPYDSQEEVYVKMFAELDHAIGILTEHRTETIAATADYVYGGNVEKWIKLANSIKLRLAMRVVYANYDLAREMAETAVAHEIGVITSNADNAAFRSFGDKGNPLHVSVKYNEVQAGDHEDGKACKTGGDTHAAADIISYMNGYDDPRRAAYFVPSEWEDYEFVGMRRGIIIPDLKSTGHKYSGVNVAINAPLYWMNAAEVAFLRAEGAAIFDFAMGGDEAHFYEQGIRLSFEQWGAQGVDEYLADDERTPGKYTDPAGSNTYNNVLSDIAVAWDASASLAQMQERIIIQKWIANWLIGNEAWADYRRTGYPRLIPATEAGNKSGGIVNSERGARRMPYPSDEYITNGQHVQNAVTNLLKGADNMATRVWWDCKN